MMRDGDLAVSLMHHKAKSLEAARARGVYFFLNEALITHHMSICLAQGLGDLGVPVLANQNAHDGLFKKTDKFPTTAQYIVLDFSGMEIGAPNSAVPFVLDLKHRTAGVSIADNTNMSTFPKEIPVFAAHANQGIRSTDWRLPWAFGLNKKALSELAKHAPGPRRRAFIRNFRPSWSQSVRQALDLALIPQLERHIEIDRTTDGGSRFEMGHFERLSRTLGCLSYGGFFLQGGPDVPVVDAGCVVIGRWDSYRFWESLAAGALTVTLDFEAYGFQLPVMPENRKHYVGIRFDTLADDVEFLTRSDELEKIAAAGRDWAIEHYSPKAVALRFIETMASIYP